MRIRLLGSSVDAPSDRQYATSYIIEDTVAVDAGSLGFHGEPQEQSLIRHLFITHSHADHIATLPIFVENVYEARPDCVTVWGNGHVLKCIREDIFNDRFWPDFVALSTEEAPFLRLERLEPEDPVEVEGLRMTPVLVAHQVRNYGFVVEKDGASVVIVSDTAPTERIWEVANALPDLRGVFLESAFPNRMRELADVSMHLTPELFRGEVAKLERDVPVIAVHIKPRFRRETEAELAALGLANVEIGVSGKEYVF